jgi:hypothetical protein
VTIDEKRAMKAACAQPAATLIAASVGGKYQIGAEECIKLAAYSMSELLRPIGESLRNTLCRRMAGALSLRE